MGLEYTKRFISVSTEYVKEMKIFRACIQTKPRAAISRAGFVILSTEILKFWILSGVIAASAAEFYNWRRDFIWKANEKLRNTHYQNPVGGFPVSCWTLASKVHSWKQPWS